MAHWEPHDAPVSRGGNGDRESSVTWHPILDGERRNKALEAIDAIVRDLPDPSDFRRAAGSHVRHGGLEWGLTDGAAGLAVLTAYLTRSVGESYDEAARDFLQYAVEAVSTSSNPSLYEGFTGVAWALEHLGAQLFASAEEDPGDDVDAALIDLVDRPWDGDYDLVQGLIGFGVYALERLPHRSGKELLTRIIDQLDRRADSTSEGITWPSLAAWMPEPYRRERPARFHDLGVAHGVPAVIAFLGHALAAGTQDARIAPLIEKAEAWLVAQQMPEATGSSSFPPWVPQKEDPSPAPSGWCYGDPGVSMALLVAARATRNTERERFALAVATRAATRPPEETGVVDAGICHGAAGLAHLFNRAFQQTLDPALHEGALTWIQRTLELRRPGEGIGGYRANRTGAGATWWEDDPGVLTGSAGIALALLAACTDTEPAWDRMLLASGRPAVRASGEPTS